MYKIILIDDEDVAIDNITNYFDWNSYNFEIIKTFTTANTAIEFCKNHKIDAVITDIKMPLMDGIEFCEYFHKLYNDVPIILLTAYQDFEYAKKAIEYQVYDYILKPISYQSLANLCVKLSLYLNNQNIDFIANNIHHTLKKSICNEPYDTTALEEALLKLDVDANISAVTTVEITLENFDNYMSSSWQHPEKNLYQALRNLMPCEDKILAVPLEYSGNLVHYILFIKTTENVKSEILNSYITNFKENCFRFLDMAVITDVVEIAPNINSFIKKQPLKQIAKHHLNFIMQPIFSGNIQAASDRLNQIYSDIKSNKHIMLILTYMLYKKLAEIIDFDSMHKFHIYPSSITLPLRLDEYNVPTDIDLMMQCIFDTVTNSAKYFSTSHTNNYDPIESAISYINTHYMENISLSQLAEKVFLSEAYFSKLFKKSQNTTYICYLNSVRIKHATELLLSTDCHGYEIAEKVGFSSSKYFYKKFKEITGYSPQEYKIKNIGK